MVMAPVGNVFSSIIIFLLLLRSLWHVVVRGEHQLNLEGIAARQTVCSEPKVLGDSSVKIVHTYGPCSPTRRQPPAVVETLARDSLRIAHLHGGVQVQAATAADHGTSAAQLGQSASMARIPVLDRATMGTLGYMIPIYVGTPWTTMHVNLDTGSDRCWIQCEPCLYCYEQEELIFNPTTSSSFSYVQCTDSGCNHRPIIRSSGNNTSCDRGRCTYRAVYGDSSRTSGFLVRDRVGLAGAVQRGNFTFGCGNNNIGRFSGTAGLFGLGHTDLSLNKQMSHMGNIFSYCLPPTYRDSGHLTIGDGPYPPAVYTPIVLEPAHPTHFFIGLLAMSVNSRLLPMPEGLFMGAKTIIDSGSVLSYIPQLAYIAPRMAISNSMTRYRLVPPPRPGGPVDTCYDLGNATAVDSPTVTLHFTDAELHLGFTQTFYRRKLNETIYCLVFVANNFRRSVPSILGVIPQRGLDVIYNLDENKIGLSTIITNCH